MMFKIIAETFMRVKYRPPTLLRIIRLIMKNYRQNCSMNIHLFEKNKTNSALIFQKVLSLRLAQCKLE
jgi:hypothetical protein